MPQPADIHQFNLVQPADIHQFNLASNLRTSIISRLRTAHQQQAFRSHP
jgi:hypothetical protein